MLRWESTSTVTSTVPGAAPDWMALSSASLRIAMTSSSVGFTTERSTMSRTIAMATPMVEMTAALRARRCRCPIVRARWGTTAAAPPPPPTNTVVRGSRW